MNRFIYLVVITLCGFISCNDQAVILRYFGPKNVVEDIHGNKDTLNYEVTFEGFVSQEGAMVNSNGFKGNVYVVDFFFTSCPTICPKMSSVLKNVYDEVEHPDFNILSISIDPMHDTVEVLSSYASKLGVESPKWTFATADKENTFLTADRFMVHASENKSEPGGFFHSSNVVLIDRNGHIRGYFDLLREEEVEQLYRSLDQLLKH